jgi:hypothetical protein
MSGAVTMKMMSKTSITSMYGTTLMSEISRWRLCRRDPMEPGWAISYVPAGAR